MGIKLNALLNLNINLILFIMIPFVIGLVGVIFVKLNSKYKKTGEDEIHLDQNKDKYEPLNDPQLVNGSENFANNRMKAMLNKLSETIDQRPTSVK
jgi:hypothetical protein